MNIDFFAVNLVSKLFFLSLNFNSMSEQNIYSVFSSAHTHRENILVVIASTLSVTQNREYLFNKQIVTFGYLKIAFEGITPMHRIMYIMQSFEYNFDYMYIKVSLYI